MPKACKVPTSGSDDGKYKFAKTSGATDHVEQEIVRLDDRADRAGDHRAAQLPAVLGFGKGIRGDLGCRHQISSPG